MGDIPEELMERYRLSFPEKLDNIRIAWMNYQKETNDALREHLAGLLHQLTGSSGAYGFDELSRATRAALNGVNGNTPDQHDQVALVLGLLKRHAEE